MRDADFDRFFKPVEVIQTSNIGCPHCLGELIEMPEGMLCKRCFDVTTVNKTDSDPTKEVILGYKRISHFRELLFQFQAKESNTIPQEVYDLVKQNGDILPLKKTNNF